ncbi:MAG: DUF1565 domain-containing protein [Candidatus Cloacimonadaceae bacterium]|nr:DUF1565 domain-containing protein [Candidatus Cloacimonadaceae bacterium]
MKDLCIWLLILSAISGLSATLITVSAAGGMDFMTIGSAIEFASAGDSILVYPGVYVENVDFIGKTITLCSLEAITGDRSYVQSTIIDGNSSGPCVAFLSGEQNATLRGFTLRNGKGLPQYSEVEIVGGGIVIYQTGRINLTNCDITNNWASMGAGISCYKGSVYLSGLNIFENHSCAGGAGVIIMGDYYQIGMVYFDPDNLCSIYSNFGAAPVDVFIVDLKRDLDIHLDMFTLDHPDEFYIYRHMNIPEFDHYTDTVSIQQGFRTEVNHDLYVSPDGDDANSGLNPGQAMKTITRAIHRIAGDSLNIKTVHVLPGTYREGPEGQILPLALKRNVNVIGAGSEQTILIADSDLPPLMQTIVWGMKAKNTIFKGFTLLSDNEELNLPMLFGIPTNNVRVSDVVIRDMKVFKYGAINIMDWISSEMDSIRIENVVTDEVIFYAMNIISGTISNSRFENLRSTFSTSDPVFTGLAMIDIWVSGSLTMKNSVFRDFTVVDNQPTFHISNRRGYSGGQIVVNVNNCLFTGLSTNDQRAVMFATNNLGSYTVSNCTFYDNYATIAPVAINGHVTMRNNVFYSPDALKEIHAYHVPPSYMFYSKLDFDYNLIRGGANSISMPGNLSILEWGNYNTSQEPAFASIDSTDQFFLHLSPASPCIDSGTPDISGLGLPPYDLAGNWRVWNGRIDMGCFEFGSEPWVTNDDPVAPDLGQIALLQNYPNPFNPATTLSFFIPASMPCRLDIFNIRGQRVKSLLNANMLAGKHSIIWNGDDDNGRYVTSGVYFYRLVTPNGSKSAKMLLVK